MSGDTKLGNYTGTLHMFLCVLENSFSFTYSKLSADQCLSKVSNPKLISSVALNRPFHILVRSTPLGIQN